jgi:uncharacterized protein VirK/YbjX
MQDKQSSGLDGYIDSLRNKELLGWCAEKGRPEPFDCELLIGDFPYQTRSAKLFRYDLLKAGINDGRHGFNFDLRTLNLDAFIQNDLKQMSVRVVGTDTKLQVSSFIPFFISKGTNLQRGPYLANFLNDQEKIDCYNTCAKFLFRKMNESLKIPKLLWTKSVDEHCLTVVLRPADFAPLEGELSVSVLFDGNTIYSLTFSVIHGNIVGRTEPLILFIGGLQGRPNIREKITASTKISDGVHPRLLLFTAILALCEAWNMTFIAAVSAAQHFSCDTPERLKSFGKNYDRFWIEMGGMAGDAEHRTYIIPAKRNSSHVHNKKHWHRSLQRRIVRDKIQQEILRNL